MLSPPTKCISWSVHHRTKRVSSTQSRLGWWKKCVNCWLHLSPCYSTGRLLPDVSHLSLNKPLYVRGWRRAGWMQATWRTTARSVSNFSFLSKLLERVVQRRLQAFLDSNELMPIASSQRTISTTALRRLSWKCTMICSWQLTVDSFLPCACSTRLLHLTPLTMTYTVLLRLERQFGLRGVTRVGSITFKMYFNYKIQITFFKVIQILFSITLATGKIQNTFLESN